MPQAVKHFFVGLLAVVVITWLSILGSTCLGGMPCKPATTASTFQSC